MRTILVFCSRCSSVGGANVSGDRWLPGSAAAWLIFLAMCPPHPLSHTSRVSPLHSVRVLHGTPQFPHVAYSLWGRGNLLSNGLHGFTLGPLCTNRAAHGSSTPSHATPPAQMVPCVAFVHPVMQPAIPWTKTWCCLHSSKGVVQICFACCEGMASFHGASYEEAS